MPSLYPTTQPRFMTRSNAPHGGRRIRRTDTSTFRAREWQLNSGQWTEVSAPSADRAGATLLSTIGLSHNADSTMYLTSNGQGGFRVLVGPPPDWMLPSSPSARLVGQIQPNSSSSPASSLCLLEVTGENGMFCGDSIVVSSDDITHAVWAYSPMGDSLYVGLNTLQSGFLGAGPWVPCRTQFIGEGGVILDDRLDGFSRCRWAKFGDATKKSEVRSIDLRTGGVTSHVWDVDGRRIAWMGIAEGGREIVAMTNTEENVYYVFGRYTAPLKPRIWFLDNVPEPAQVIAGCRYDFHPLHGGTHRSIAMDTCEFTGGTASITRTPVAVTSERPNGPPDPRLRHPAPYAAAPPRH